MSEPGGPAVHGGAFFDDVGVDFRRLDRLGRVVNADVLDAWYPPAPGVLSALGEHLERLVRTSPPTHAEGLVRTIAEVRGLPVEAVLPGGGSSALIYLALPRLIDHRHPIAVPLPSYGEYAHLVEHVLRLPLLRPPLEEAADFAPDPAALAEEAAGVGLFVLVNPNSPTGAQLPPEGVLELRDRLPAGTLLLVDETYTDFVDPVRGASATSVESEAARRENLLVLKSMSKWYALSGERVGYLVAHPRVVARLRPWMPPWAVGLPAQVAAVAALRDEAYYRERSAETARLRDALAERLRALPGLRVLPSVANFLLLRASPQAPTAGELVARARAEGVYLRDCASLMTGDEDRWLRTAVKSAEDNERIAAALENALTA